MISSSETIRKTLQSQIIADPGLPVEAPTISAWQVPPHPLPQTRSDSLPSAVDCAVIGSGITGCSVAKTILENSQKSVTVFEARALCSGATGRNGGHLASTVPKEFEGHATRDGLDEAVKLARYHNRTIENVAKAAFAEKAGCGRPNEIRSVKEIMSFADTDSFSKAWSSMQMYEEHVAEERGSHQQIPGSEAKAVSLRRVHVQNRPNFSPHQQEYTDSFKSFHLRTCDNVVSTKGYAIWPYRFVANKWQELFEQYNNRLTIELQTPVLAIRYEVDDEYPYVVKTHHGTVRARQIFHCANAWSGHLLPGLRGKLFPMRLTMNCQKCGPNFPYMGSKYLWLLYQRPEFDAENQVGTGGLFYLHQNAESGDLYCGGEKRRFEEVITANDGDISSAAKENLQSLVAQKFEPPWTDSSDIANISHQWSGIIGGTADGNPFVGRVPHKWSGRCGEEEWIAAGYNGYGMSQAWSCGEVIARMALGEPVPSWFPAVCLSNEERLNDESRMSSESIINQLIGGM